MAKRVFFTFHYADIFRVNIVRNHWVTKENQSSAGFFDWSIWEESMKTSELALKRMINSALDGTSVSCVLIGSSTHQRHWVKYELFKSIERFNKLLGVHVNSLKTPQEGPKMNGQSPFPYMGIQVSPDGRTGVPFVHNGVSWTAFGPLERLQFPSLFNPDFRGKFVTLDRFALIYDWQNNGGYERFSQWIE